jgi:hypothetical protein
MLGSLDRDSAIATLCCLRQKHAEVLLQIRLRLSANAAQYGSRLEPFDHVATTSIATMHAPLVSAKRLQEVLT